MALLEVTDLDVHYGGIHALKGVSFTVDEGQIVALIGANGAGKTTTLRAISGLLRPGRGIFANLTVEENLQLGAYLRGDPDAVARDLERALGLFPRLRERLGQNAGTLSGGEQQMLAIARALLARPRLLLLDEPSLGLAPQMVQLIFRIVKTIVDEGTTILLVEQNAHMALGVAARAHVLEVGALVTSGPAAELLRDDQIRRAYLGVHEP
jgi:branched-chain amino acid transport system ATP-binding protein